MNHLPTEVSPTYDISYAPVRAYHEKTFGNTLSGLWRRRGLILAVLALSLFAAGAALVVMKKKYSAQATVQLDLGQRETTPIGQQNAGVALDASAIVQGEASIIRSRMIARRVVYEMKLGDAAPDSGPTMLTQATQSVVQAIRSVVGLPDEATGASEPANDRIEAANDHIEAVVTAVLSHLVVTTDNRSYQIQIVYTAENPARAATIANAFAQEYLQRRGELNQSLTTHVTEWLRGQIQASTAALNEAEKNVAAYRQKTQIVDASANGETVYQQQLRDLNAQLSAATLARVNEDSRAARVRQMVASGVPPAASDVAGSTIIQDLLEQEVVARQHLNDLASTMGTQNPQLGTARAAVASAQAAAEAQMRNAVTTAQASAQAAGRVEQDLRVRLDMLQKAVISEKVSRVELDDLQAKAQALRQRLASLAQSYDQALADKNLQLVAGSLVIPAEGAPIPSSPKPLLLFAIAILCAGVGGGGLALLLERRDRGFRSITEVRELTGLRCLAILPELTTKRWHRKQGRRQTPQEIAFEENIRALGTGVGLFGNTQQCRVVLVTSSLPREGKSIICKTLARILAAVGYRVLLIDSTRAGEMRGAHSLGAKDEPANSLVLLSTSSSGGAARSIHQGSTIMTEIFGPEKLDQLIEDARQHFDIVLIDGAPTLLLADSFVIGRKADIVIHVIQWGKTLKSTVMTALQRMSEQSLRVDATVLARAEPGRSSDFEIADGWEQYRASSGFRNRLLRRRARPKWAPQPAQRGSTHAA